MNLETIKRNTGLKIMNRDQFINKLQGKYGKTTEVNIEDIKEWIMLEGLSDNDIDLLYKLVKRHHKVNYFPKDGQIIDIWERFGARQEKRTGMDANQKALQDGAGMTIEQIHSKVWQCRDKEKPDSFDYAFIARWDNLCYYYTVFKEKYGETFAVTKCEEKKQNILNGTALQKYEYLSEINDEFIDKIDNKRENKVVGSEEVINKLFPEG